MSTTAAVNSLTPVFCIHPDEIPRHCLLACFHLYYGDEHDIDLMNNFGKKTRMEKVRRFWVAKGASPRSSRSHFNQNVLPTIYDTSITVARVSTYVYRHHHHRVE